MQTTIEHMHDTHGNVNLAQPRKQKSYSGIAKFLAGVTMALALTLGITGILLHTSMKTNANAKVKLENAEVSRQYAEERVAELTELNNKTTSRVAELEEKATNNTSVTPYQEPVTIEQPVATTRPAFQTPQVLPIEISYDNDQDFIVE